MLAQSAVRKVQAMTSVAELEIEGRTIDIVLANDAHGAFVWVCSIGCWTSRTAA